MQPKAGSPTTATPEVNGSTMSMPTCGVNLPLPRSATAGSTPPSNAPTSSDRSPRCDGSTPTPKSSPTLPVGSTSSAKDCSPYWSECIAAINSRLWLPTGTSWPGSVLNSSSGWCNRTAATSWFSTSRMAAPNQNSPRIYSPSSIRSAAECTASDATARQSHRIRVYPNSSQKGTICDVAGSQPLDLQPDG